MKAFSFSRKMGSTVSPRLIHHLQHYRWGRGRRWLGPRTWFALRIARFYLHFGGGNGLDAFGLNHRAILGRRPPRPGR